MPLDPSIPLQVKAPTFETPDFAKTIANAATIKKAQLEQAKAEVEDQFQMLAGATPENFGQIRAQAVAKYGADADSRLPKTYDEGAIKQLGMSLLTAKDRVELESKKLEMQLNQDKFGEEKRHNLADEAINQKKADSPFGTSFQGKAYNTLLNGDPNSPAYALAASAATATKFIPVVNADGTTTVKAVTPELPDIIRRPGMGAPNPMGKPSDVLTPPVVNGAADATPTTQGPLLAAPSVAGGRQYDVADVPGATGAAKLTDDQTKAAGFAQRMESSNGILNGLSDNKYVPSVATDTLGNSKIGNALLGSQGQQFIQAKRDFVNAVLRRESGAAISSGEFDNADKQYFQQPGDSKEVIANKARLRQEVIQNMKLSAGGAMKRMSDMNASAPQAIPSLPAGATQIGTSGGKPVYATPDGKHFVAQ